jgi:hypothetical protein
MTTAVEAGTVAGELVALAHALERVNGPQRRAVVWDVSGDPDLLLAAEGIPSGLLDSAARRLEEGSEGFEIHGDLGAFLVVHVCTFAGQRAAYGLFVDGAGHAHVETTVSRLLHAAESDLGKPVAEMNRVEKQRVVRFLDERGAFLIRRAVEDVADRLGVTRFTIYNYLDRDK